MVLEETFSSKWWDVLIAYEDVERTKPSGEGVHSAMIKLGISNPTKVLVVGDSRHDILAAYDAGAIAAIDMSSWPRLRKDYTPEHWECTNLVPDFFIETPTALFDIIGAYDRPKSLPELERLLSGFLDEPDEKRFDKINMFIPSRLRGNNERVFYVYCCGRYFSRYEYIKERREIHPLTESILKNKDADAFPEEWIAAIHSFIRTNRGITRALQKSGLVVTVIPHRPGRKAVWKISSYS